MAFSSRRQRAEQGRVRNPQTAELDAGRALFTRSRALTGSISSKVAAAVESTSNLKSARLEEHELRHHRRKLSTVLLGCVVAAAALVWCIDSLVVFLRPADPASHNERYIAVVESYLASHPAERFFPLLQTSRLTAYAQQTMPEIASVSLDGHGLFSPYLVSVVERHALASWQLGGKTYYVDSSGVAFERLTATNSKLVTVKDESGLPVAAQQVASRRTMQFIGQVVSQVSSQSVGIVEQVILPTGLLKEIDIVLEGRSYRIKLLIDRDPTRQVSDIASALRYIDAQGITPKYVDLRVEGKAYYLE